MIQCREGFGFIARNDGGKDVFVHISVLERSGLTILNQGERVIVNVVDGRAGGGFDRRAEKLEIVPSVYMAVRWTMENMPRGNWSAVMNEDERATPSA